MAERAEQFVDALHGLEKDGDVETIAALFAQGADVSNPMVEHDREGPGGARAFWRSYRSAFDAIWSEFRHVEDAGDVSFLEWVSEGAIGGRPVRYGGVSVLEHGDGGITAFRTYFDPTPLTKRVTADAKPA